MDYKELMKDWKSEDLFRFDVHDLTSKGLNQETTDFLSNVGLPTSVAPYLSFVGDLEKELRSVFDTYETGEVGHKYFLSIGTDGAGNPICIDIKNDCQVVVLNHEEDFSSTFMNSSVVELFQFLTLYKSFVEDVIGVNGEDAFLDANFTDKQYEELKKGMEVVEDKALRPNTSWAQELKLLLVNRENF
ncbi:SUKH-4 family immunity protein [Pontibacter virosus]|uniref:SUKH-4 immunity protein of toxin-antitoxin system n=1 Tax=Pontibacter virosus TaxID=1765052 RepID=A0A2U1AXH1_9BACT|nr:SUKH-4 family immunity protein [Pontibacter virosus]PVY41125.1 SUKH-4 immunity protein of toxin-antitoxin system [Pontibacter virosus]